MFANNPRHFLALAWGLVFCIITLSLLPSNSIPKFSWTNFLAIDKLGHFTCYGLTAWSFTKYSLLKYKINRNWYIGSSLFLLGVMLEVLQFCLKQGRRFDVLDVFASRNFLWAEVF